MKIVQINGFRGLITVAFIGTCLFAGFVLFPGYVAMYLWNKYLTVPYMLPVLNLFQGVLLWAIVAVSYLIVTKKDMAVSFKSSRDLSDSELDMIIKRAKINSQLKKMNGIIQKFDRFEMSNKFTDDLKEKKEDSSKDEVNFK